MAAVDVLEVLRLDAEPQHADVFLAPRHAENLNGRAYGGQLLGQAMRAAAMTVQNGRRAHSLQASFARGARVDRPIRYEVTRMLDGGRYSGRHVRGTQDGQVTVDVNVSFQAPLSSPLDHQLHVAPAVPMPDEVPDMHALERQLRAAGLSLHPQLVEPFGCEMRVVDGFRVMSQPVEESRLLFWMRIRQPLPNDDECLHDAGLAYLSDLFISASSYMRYTPLGQFDDFYASSLNHSMWMHTACRADEWLLIESHGSRTTGGRGLCNVRAFDRAGLQVATFAQECAIAPRR